MLIIGCSFLYRVQISIKTQARRTGSVKEPEYCCILLILRLILIAMAGRQVTLVLLTVTVCWWSGSVLAQLDDKLLLEVHNNARSSVNPPAKNMLKMVTSRMRISIIRFLFS